MADNLLITEGTTASVATDEVGTVHFQKMKVNLGGDGVDGSTWDGNVGVTTPGTITSGSVAVTSGTVSVNTPGTITSGTVSVNTPGTITSGSVAITAGTIGAGTLNTLGTLSNLVAGTIQSSGTTTGVGVVTALTNGTVRVEAGTITNSGTVTGVGVVSNLTNGSVRVTAGTINSGTINAGTINAGTVSGKDAHAAGTTVNPILISGNNNGTSRAFTVDNSGNVGANVVSGTIQSSGTTTGVGVVSEVTNGSIRVTAGTMTNSGTVTGVGVVTSLTDGTVRVAAGTINNGSIVVTAGTVGAGTINTMGTLSNLVAGTLQSSGTTTGVGVVTNLTNGSVNVIAGTVNSGTINAGTITNFLKAEDSGHTTGDMGNMPLAVRVDGGTSLVGTDLDYAPLQVDANGALRIAGTVATGAGTQPVSIISGTINSGTVVGNVASGAADSGNPVKVGGKYNSTPPTLTDGQRGDLQVSSAGRLLVDSIAAGTTIGTINAGTINSGTINAGTVDILSGTIQSVGTVPGIGVLSNLTNGSVRVTAGTITSGTVDSVTTVTTVSNLTNGTVRVTAGTVNSGTINAGTINSGTINAGTVTNQPYPASQVLSAFAIGTGAVGTLVSAAGAGTGIYIHSIALKAMSGTLDMCLSFALGSTTNQVVERGLYVAGGGIALPFSQASFYGTANAALTYQILGGAGTASWNVTYSTKGTP